MSTVLKTFVAYLKRPALYPELGRKIIKNIIMKYGVVISFNTIKQMGNIKDNTTNIEYGFLKADCPHAVEMLDEVKFDVVFEKNKNKAINVQLA